MISSKILNFPWHGYQSKEHKISFHQLNLGLFATEGKEPFQRHEDRSLGRNKDKTWDRKQRNIRNFELGSIDPSWNTLNGLFSTRTCKRKNQSPLYVKTAKRSATTGHHITKGLLLKVLNQKIKRCHVLVKLYHNHKLDKFWYFIILEQYPKIPITSWSMKYWQKMCLSFPPPWKLTPFLDVSSEHCYLNTWRCNPSGSDPNTGDQN